MTKLLPINKQSPQTKKPTQLNPAQKQASQYIDSPLLVLAGAGSGKTSVITQKITWLIAKCGIAARHIAAVTFTNKAAREMRERVNQLLPSEKTKGLTVSTFHQLGLKIIGSEIRHLDRKAGFSIFDDQDSKALLKELFLDHSDQNDALVDICQAQISDWKNDCLRADQVSSWASNQQEQRIVEVYKRYEQALSSYNAVDFDDLINLPVHLFEQNPDILKRWQQKIRYLLVDEYQDTNTSQYRLVQLLVGDRNGLTVVGDDDQSIYAWRGAKPENLVQLQTDFPTLKIIKLEQNYRSTNRILKAANTLIDNNPHVYKKALWSDKGLGDAITILQVGNEEVEAERVADLILERKMLQQAKFKEMAVLIRSNHQSKLLEMKLQSKQIPFHLTGGTSFFARGEIKDIMSYLRVLVNPDDDAAVLRIINVPRRKIGTSTLEILGNYATQRECSLMAAIDEFGLEQQMPSANLERLKTFSRWFNHLRKRVDQGQAIAAIKEMINDIDYLGWLHQNSSSSSVAERRMENVFWLVDAIEKDLRDLASGQQASPAVDELHFDETGEPQEPESYEDDAADLDAVIRKLVLRDLLDQQSEELADDKVQIMTLHASKGLEFPHVFIMGFEEEILPHRNSIENDDVEEERRLAYVGITRAQKTLTLLLAKQRKQFGDMLNCQPSRFIDELPSEDIQKVGFGGEPCEQVNQKKASQTLSSLKNLFD